MVPLFHEDVDGKPLVNSHLLPRRNWCGIRIADDGETPFELDVALNIEINCKDPSGTTKPYTVRIPALTL